MCAAAIVLQRVKAPTAVVLQSRGTSARSPPLCVCVCVFVRVFLFAVRFTVLLKTDPLIYLYVIAYST